MSNDDDTVYLHDIVRDDIAGRIRDAAEAAGGKADMAAIRRGVEAEMSDSRGGRRR
jgi:hypothetical protein